MSLREAIGRSAARCFSHCHVQNMKYIFMTFAQLRSQCDVWLALRPSYKPCGIPCMHLPRMVASSQIVSCNHKVPHLPHIIDSLFSIRPCSEPSAVCLHSNFIWCSVCTPVPHRWHVRCVYVTPCLVLHSIRAACIDMPLSTSDWMAIPMCLRPCNVVDPKA